MERNLSGATLLMPRRDGRSVNHLSQRKFKSLVKRNAVERNAMATEENKPKQDQAKTARDGILNLLTSTTELQRNIQNSVSGTTTAETQMVPSLSGATPLIKRRDGRTVTQLLKRRRRNLKSQRKNLETRNAQESSAMATEESRPRLLQEEIARDGMSKLLTSILILQRRSQRLVLLTTTAETQMVKRQSGATRWTRERDGSSVNQSKELTKTAKDKTPRPD